jgi:hypothetical protein
MNTKGEFEADTPSDQQRLTSPSASGSMLDRTMSLLSVDHRCNLSTMKMSMRFKVLWALSFTLLFYYLIGIAYYASEMKWGFTDSMYFITVSLSVSVEMLRRSPYWPFMHFLL